MSKNATQVHRRRFLKTATFGRRRGCRGADDHSQLGPGPGRRRGPQRADRGGRHRHRQPRHLRPGLLPGTEGRAVRGRLRREGGPPRPPSRRSSTTKYGNQNCDMYRDFRELLDRSDIDAVLIATGPNWHATAAINAAKAGKDMYCEKPCTKNIVAKPDRWPTRCAAPAACFRPARSGGTCRTSPSPASWPAPASSASSRRSTPTRRA